MSTAIRQDAGNVPREAMRLATVEDARFHRATQGIGAPDLLPPLSGIGVPFPAASSETQGKKA